MKVPKGMKSLRLGRVTFVATGIVCIGVCLWPQLALAAGADIPVAYSSPPPMRPLPVTSHLPLSAGPRHFVDAAHGSDDSAGTSQKPWKTLAFALRQLKAGDTLYLRGGIYYEKISLSQSGTARAPITIASYPGEMAIIDGGLREFLESPATAWKPFPDGAPDEFISTATYLRADDRKVPNQSLPDSPEAMMGAENERPLALGNFADSMVPLHGYRIAADLRATNELWLDGKDEMRETGIYGGPGLWFDRQTGRIHIRLAHNQLAGLENQAYRGETDPRKLPLVIGVGSGEDVIRINGVQNVKLQGLVLRGGTGSPMVNVYGSQNIQLDHLTVFGGSPALLVDASKDIHVTNSAFRGLAAPWISRALMKYRGTAAYQIMLRDHEPMNENIEFVNCEFTDGHDFAFLRYAKNLQFHQNFVDNFNDDGLECGPKLRNHSFFIYQNRIQRCLIPLTQHEVENDRAIVNEEPDSGLFVFRNVFDLRGGTYKFPPTQPDPSGAFLREEGGLAGDHGSPIWPTMRFYQNTVVRQTPVFRDLFLFGLGVAGLQNTRREVFNNVFVQTEKLPGVSFTGMKQAENIREGGNLLWGLKDGPAFDGDPFAKFRTTFLFTDSLKRYEPGWTTQDRLANPRFVHLVPDDPSVDLRLQAGSPAVNAGQSLPIEWPDPTRAEDRGAPDIGVLPLGAAPWRVGVDGRLPLFGTDLPGHEQSERSQKVTK